MNDLQAQIESMIALVENAQAQIARDETVMDLSALENDAAALCDRITRAEPALARSLQPLMGELIAHLDELETRLRDFKTRKESE